MDRLQVPPPQQRLATVVSDEAARGGSPHSARSLGGPLLDPASPVSSAVSLYPVAMSARPEQADLEAAFRAADERLVLVPRCWSWGRHSPGINNSGRHSGRRGHSFTITGFGIGTRTMRGRRDTPFGLAIITLTPSAPSSATISLVMALAPWSSLDRARETAATSLLLRALRQGVYDVYSVIDPVRRPFAIRTRPSLQLDNRRIEAVGDHLRGPGHRSPQLVPAVGSRWSMLAKLTSNV